MTILTEGKHTGEFIVSTADKTRAFDQGALITGQNLAAGTVLGKITVGAASSAAKAGGNTGNGVLGAVTVGAGAQPGVYSLRITAAASNAGAFEVKDPQGDVVGTGNVGAAFSGGGLSFTLADGATDFIVADGFDITVAAGSGKFTQLAPAATDGSQNAAALLFDNVNATAADKPCTVVARDAEVNVAELTYPVGITSPQRTAANAQLVALGIVLR